jgi:hypothetical protein
LVQFRELQLVELKTLWRLRRPLLWGRFSWRRLHGLRRQSLLLGNGRISQQTD